jgi:hypothetical protein
MTLVNGDYKETSKGYYGVCPKCGEKTFYLWKNKHSMWLASCSRVNNCNYYVSPKELFATQATPIVDFKPSIKNKREDWENYNNEVIENYLATKCRDIRDDEVAMDIALRRTLNVDNLFAQYGKIIIPATTINGKMYGLKVYDRENTECKYQWRRKLGDYELADVPSHIRVIGLENLTGDYNVPVFLTEGTFDAHCFVQGISYESAGLSPERIKFLQDTLSNYKEVYWVVDRDKAGHQVAEKLLKNKILRSNILVTPALYKDANELSMFIMGQDYSKQRFLDKSDLEVV